MSIVAEACYLFVRNRVGTYLRKCTITQEGADEVTEYNYIDNIGSMDNSERRKASLVYLADADKRRNRNLFKYRTLMVVSGKRGDAFDLTVTEILNYCKSVGIVATRVTGNMDKFLGAFSPFAMELGNGALAEVGANTIPDEQIARFSIPTLWDEKNL